MARPTTTEAVVLRSLVYLGALIDRMNRRGFSPDDRLFRRALEAFDKVHALNIELHYMSCKAGVGRLERKA